jgi:hypothetical protein
MYYLPFCEQEFLSEISLGLEINNRISEKYKLLSYLQNNIQQSMIERIISAVYSVNNICNRKI